MSGFAKFRMMRSYSSHAREHLLGHFARAHLRLQIVGRDFRRRHDLAIFAGKGLLDSAVKKVGDVRIFLRLGDAQLRLARGAHDLAQDVSERFRREDVRRRVGHVVLRERDVVHLRMRAAIEAVEIRVREKPARAGARGRPGS